MQVSIDPKWLHDDWQWYVGVHCENMSEAIGRELLRPGTLNWKMGSAQQVDLLFRYNMPDVKAAEPLPADRRPRALPSQKGGCNFEVPREGTSLERCPGFTNPGHAIHRPGDWEFGSAPWSA